MESAAGGVEGTLFLLGAVMKEWAAVLVDHLAEKVFRSHKRLAQRISRIERPQKYAEPGFPFWVPAHLRLYSQPPPLRPLSQFQACRAKGVRGSGTTLTVLDKNRLKVVLTGGENGVA